MTFYPKAGDWSVNDFTDSNGAYFQDSTKQYITGGYVTLLPQNTSEYTFISSWTPFTGWSRTNGMETRSVVTGLFLITGSLQYAAGIYSGVSGYQQSVVSAGAWEIFTDRPTIDAYTGTINSSVQCLVLNSGSPYSGWATYFNAGGGTATIEFDVASYIDPYSGLDNLQGYTTGQNNLTGLPAKTGLVGHGIYISNGTYNDYLEVLPFGIRSISKPEIAIPCDLTSPTRFRIGISNQDLYIQSEDGRSTVGLSRFNKTTTTLPTIAIGAPFITGSITKLATDFGVYSTVGDTYWGSFKVVTGQLITQSLSGQAQSYSTAGVYMYTDVFDPSVTIDRYVSATIGYVPYQGGTTTITPQYSGTTGFIDSTSYSITSTSANPLLINLSSIPVRSYPTQNINNTYVSNPIRFKITQTSSDGKTPPPAIDYIQLVAAKERSILEITPNWKLTNVPVVANMSLRSGDFIQSPPESNLWTSLLINTPSNVGYITNTGLYDSSRSGLTISVIGTGLIEAGGRYGYCYTNQIYLTGSATTGSTAATYFGTAPVSNFFPNPLFEEFKPVASEPNYYTGYLFGQLGMSTYVPPAYTGGIQILYEAAQVYKPESAARDNRLYRILGLTTNPTVDYVQSVTVQASNQSTTHNGSAGIEARVPSGIATSLMQVDLDLRIEQGPGLTVYVSGDTPTISWFLPGEDYRVFRQVGFPITGANRGEIRIGFVAPTGYSTNEVYKYQLDNLTVSPISTSYLSVSGLPVYNHRSGISTTPSGTVDCSPGRASTVFNTDLYLNSYPTNTGIIFEVKGTGNRGIQVGINGQGYITTSLDLMSECWAAGPATAPFKEYVGRQTFSSTTKFPLGQWINLGVIHQAHTYQTDITTTNISNNSGDGGMNTFASCNRAYITFNGIPVQSIDCESGWLNRNVSISDSAPVLTYVTATGNITTTIMSGVYGSVDGLRFDRPPVADAEVELSLEGARVTTPYFVPDVLSNGTADDSVPNVYVYSAWAGNQIFLGSCYNFTNPGYTHWDHGPWRNHLLFSGSIAKESISPYTGLGSTRFYTGAKAIATYSSATERIINSEANLGITTDLVGSECNLGKFAVQGWIYPRTSGSIFTILENVTSETGSRVALEYNGSKITFSKYNNANALVFGVTGTITVPYSGWSYVGVDYKLPVGVHSTGVTGTAGVVLFNGTGVDATAYLTGLNYGFRYGGHTGDSINSAFKFAGNIDANYCDWVLRVPSNNAIPKAQTESGINFYTGNKQGRYQVLMEGSSRSTLSPSWTGFGLATVNLPVSTNGSEKLYWVASMNAYDNNVMLNGGCLLYPDKPFEELSNYSIQYDTSLIDGVFGATDSPIRIGYTVPDNAVNIARVDNVEFTSDRSITTIDLSSSNVNNLSDYKGGLYSISRNNGAVVPSVSLTGVNSGLYIGRADVTFSGNVYSKNIELSTIPIASPTLTVPSEAYYFYLVGRGNYGVYLPSAYPHNYTGIVSNYTGSKINNYCANLQSIKTQIQLKNSNGVIIDQDTYPYDIVITPYSPNTYYNYTATGTTVNLDCVNATGNIPLLPNGVFSVVLLTNKKSIDGTSVWVYYNGYDYNSATIAPKKEVVNPLPISRFNQYYESPEAGRYSIVTDTTNNNYNLVLYGIESGLSGTI